MRKAYILLLSGILICCPLAADIFADVAAAERNVVEQRTELARKQEELRALRRTAETLETTAEVTLDPSRKPEEKKKEPEVIYRNPLTSLDGFKGQKGEARIEDGAIRIDSPGAESVYRSIPVPAEGAEIRVSVKMKGEQVVKREKKHFNGTRLGANYRFDGKSFWPAARAGEGTFDWREVSFQFTTPAGCGNFRLIIGLAGADGTVWVKDLVVEKLQESAK